MGAYVPIQHCLKNTDVIDCKSNYLVVMVPPSQPKLIWHGLDIRPKLSQIRAFLNNETEIAKL